MFWERLFIICAVAASSALLIVMWRLFLQHRLDRLAAGSAPNAVRNLVSQRAPSLLYFTTDNCAQCRFQQAPVLDRFAAQSQIPVYSIDAVEQELLARFYGIMTVPSTVLLNERLQPVAINHGLAHLPRLRQQLMAVHADSQ